MYLYKNQYTLPLGFLIPDTLENKWSHRTNNPFAVQNSFADLAANVSPIFSQASYKIKGNTVDIYPEHDSYLYIYVSSDGEDFAATFTDGSGSTFREPETYTGIRNRYIIDLGRCPAGSHIAFSATGKDSIHANVYSLNVNNFKTLHQTLSERGLEITEWKETRIKGTITAESDMLLLTSILYEKGWSVKIDGKKVPVQAFKDALVSVPVTAGTHEIVFSYSPYGLNVGLLISAVSLAALIGIIVWKIQKKKRKHVEEKE